jgi:hypothetical protein
MGWISQSFGSKRSIVPSQRKEGIKDLLKACLTLIISALATLKRLCDVFVLLGELQSRKFSKTFCGLCKR